MAVEIFKDDIGTIIEATIYDEIDVIVDISGVTLLQFILKKPSNSIITRTAIFTTDGTDGKMRYTTVTGDIDEAGVWKIQGYVEIGASLKYHTTITEFDVDEFLAR